MTDQAKEALSLDLIVADVGGTNGRFAIARLEPGRPEIALRAIRSYRNAGLRDFEELLGHYLADVAEPVPARACFGVAGPVDAAQGRITNLGWILDRSRLQRRFGLEDVFLVNDFAALAWMIPELAEDASTRLSAPDGPVHGPRSVIGPGTGFGVALLVENGARRLGVSTECGHMSFAPTTRLESELKAFLEPALGHVSVESLLSGAGLVRIHDFLIEYAGSGSPAKDPAQITLGALDGSQPSCARAVQIFLSILGSVAGDIALAHGATGGVCLGGGVLPRIASLIPASNFLERFIAKGPMRDYLKRIPVHLITAPHVALQGAAAIYRDQRVTGS